MTTSKTSTSKKTTSTTKATTRKPRATKKLETGFKPSVLNFDEATRVEFDKELKRIASNKCNAKHRAERAEAAKKADEAKIAWTEYEQNTEDYARVKAAKEDKFPGRKTYMDYTEEDIAKLNLEQTLAAIASLDCRRHRYPSLDHETLPQERKFIARRNELRGKVEGREALKNMTKAEIEELLAELES